VKAKLHSSN